MSHVTGIRRAATALASLLLVLALGLTGSCVGAGALSGTEPAPSVPQLPTLDLHGFVLRVKEAPLSYTSIYPGTAGTGDGHTQSGTFRVNPQMPLYRCVTTSEKGQYGYDTTTRIVISDAGSGKVVQEIVPSEYNCNVTSSSAYFVDVNFDGNLDLLVPGDILQKYGDMVFDAYIWDAGTMQFEECPSFRTICNPSFIGSSKRILSFQYSDHGQQYKVFTYQDGQFVETNSFTWFEPGMDPTRIDNVESHIHCIEIIGVIDSESNADSRIIVADFYAPVPVPVWGLTKPCDRLGPYFNKDAPQLAPYLAAGSFWDLDSPRWECPFQADLIDPPYAVAPPIYEFDFK